MIVYVTGGRVFDDVEMLDDALDGVYGFTSEPHFTIVTDMDQGVGLLAQQWARKRGETCVYSEARDPSALIARYKPDQGVIFAKQADPETRDAVMALFDARVHTWIVGDRP